MHFNLPLRGTELCMIKLLTCTTLLYLTWNSLALAQTPPQVPPGSLYPPRQDLPPVPQTLSSPTIRTLPLTAPTTQPVPSQPGSVPTAKVKVKRVEVLGSKAFSTKELAKAVAPFKGKLLSFDQLLETRTAITNLYTRRGYTTSGAFLPPQDISSGVIKIQVIEGELERVEIQGLKRLKESYVRSRIGLAATSPINIGRLEKALQLLQLDPLFSKVQAELTTGTAMGRSVLVLDLKEAQVLSSALVVENRESPSVGSTGSTAILSSNNLLGLGDQLSAEVGLTEGIDKYSVGYEIPLTARNGTLALRYNNGDSRIIEKPFDTLDINGRTQTYSLSFRQPINRSPTNEFALSLSGELRRSQTYILNDEPYSFTEGAERGKSRATVIRFGQVWVNRSTKQVLAARSQFSLGVDAFNATVNDTGTDGRFFSWLGQFQWVQALNKKKDTILVARAAAQLTPDSLLPLEQFSVGGLDTVRGYRQNQRVGDNGIIGSAEVRVPIVNHPEGFGVIQIAPFIDVGTIWSNSDKNFAESGTLASTGLGLRWQLGSRFSARLDYGIPLIPVKNQSDSLQDNGIHFSVNFQPF